MTSYQKLKAKLKEQQEYINKLLGDRKFHLTESITFELRNAIRKDINNRLMFGDSKPTGKVKFKGFFSKHAKK